MLDEPSIMLSDAAKLADVEYGALRNWIQRGAIELAEDDQLAEGRGGRTMVTLRTVLGMAIMRELTRVGFSPHVAGTAAGTTMLNPQPYDSGPQKWLEPGGLFPEGKTYLLVFVPKVSDDDPDNKHWVECWRVRVVEPKDYADLFGNIVDPNATTRIVINLSALFERVHRNLAELRESRRAGEGRRR